MSEEANAVQIHPDDNVVTVTAEVPAEGVVRWAGGQVRALQAVPFAHKVAIRVIEAGEVVRKYGQPIGNAAGTIAGGEHVHSHNLAREEAEES